MLEQIFSETVYPIQHLIAEDSIAGVRKILHHDILEVIERFIYIAVVLLELLYRVTCIPLAGHKGSDIRKDNALFIFEMIFHLSLIIGEESRHDLLLRGIARLDHRLELFFQSLELLEEIEGMGVVQIIHYRSRVGS